jgi:hypothetical protein
MIWVARKTGRCANGAERDAGAILHVVMTLGESGPGWGRALCGTSPGARFGNGWAEVEDVQLPTCPRCRRALEKARAQ